MKISSLTLIVAAHPIHDSAGMFAALTFASAERQPLFFRLIDRYDRVLQLIAIFFHLHACRKLADGRMS